MSPPRHNCAGLESRALAAPVETAVTPLRAFTSTGLLLQGTKSHSCGPVNYRYQPAVLVATPSFDRAVLRSAMAVLVPAEIALTALRPVTVTGLSLASFFPLPSSPHCPSPNDRTSPSSSRARLYVAPRPTAVTPLRPFTSTGLRLQGVFSAPHSSGPVKLPVPSVPSRL